MFEEFILDIDFEDFQPNQLSSWIQLLSLIPRFPYFYLFDCICACYLVRNFVRINSRILSFVITAFVASMTDNLFAATHDRRLALFENQDLLIYFTPVWIIFNCCPFDVFYKIFNFIRPLIGLLNGALLAQAVTIGTDVAVEFYPSDLIIIFAFGIVFGIAKYILIFVTQRSLKQNGLNIFVFLFEVIVAFCMYYWFTDLGHISDKFWFDKEYVRFFSMVTVAIIDSIRTILPESFITAICNLFSSFVAYFVPYYGSIWIQKKKCF